MKYKIKGDMILRACDIHKGNPPTQAFNELVRHFGWSEPIIWNEDTEDFFVTREGWVSWLLEQGFIEERAVNFNSSKVYIYKSPLADIIYKLHRVVDTNEYAWICLEGSHSYVNGKHKTARDALLSVDQDQILVFNSLKEYYNIAWGISHC